MSAELYDVAIIGGGPAGSTAATLLARTGRRVIVFEKEKFPRFHIGESLLPSLMPTFDRLGVREQLDRTFMPKYGGEIAAACGGRQAKFYFKDGFNAKQDRAYQVTRSIFDELLLNQSRASGAEVHEETIVNELSLGERSVVLETVSAAGRKTITASYLIDCSGRQTVVGNFCHLKRSYQHLQKFSIFAHYENVDRPSGIDGTLIRMVRGLDRWFWMIPLTPTRMSIGVVMDTKVFRALKLSPEEALTKCIEEQPVVTERMTHAERVSPVYAAGDYSYRNVQLHGDRWLLAGDAAGFIDPVFSSGVYLAVLSGEKAADTLEQVLREPHRRRKLFQSYERSFNSVLKMYLSFVNSWYSGREFMEVFLNPTDILQIAPAVNALLAGNASNSFPVRWRMWLFYFFVRAQRYIPFSPRLTLTPTKAEGSALTNEPVTA
ncbi:MAG: tryptophan 7-halogenase [Chthoniobacterales bacterium]|nr:tryptophan 7-halogenase [Chthoniobacterales bacterium]